MTFVSSRDACVDTLVVGLHLRWRGVWQRPNHIVSRMASHARVIVVEEPVPAETDRTDVFPSGNVTLVVPQRRDANEMVDDRTIETVRQAVGYGRAALWLYSPLMARLAEVCPGAPIVYDKMDELAAFAGADARMREREAELLRRASVVFAGGRSLWETVRAQARAGAAFPSAVDAHHFLPRAAARVPRGNATAQNRRPVFGYLGVLDERLDLHLIAELARARPDATIELIGPVAKIDPASLPVAANIRYRGKIEYDEIPQALTRFDVALMPFARNAATRYISPTKTLEYLAAGLPVVSTDIADVVSDFADVVSIAGTTDDFIAAVGRAERPDDTARRRGLERASRQSWEAVVAGMLDELHRAGVRFRETEGGPDVSSRHVVGDATVVRT